MLGLKWNHVSKAATGVAILYGFGLTWTQRVQEKNPWSFLYVTIIKKKDMP